MNWSKTTTTFVKQTMALFMVLFVLFGAVGVTLNVFQEDEALAAIQSNVLPYQGRLLNTNGVPVADASAEMIFEIYNDAVAGSCVWSNSASDCSTATSKTISLTDGLFSESLGATGDGYASIPDDIFDRGTNLYLQVTINGETLTPRKSIAATPFALNADQLQGHGPDEFVATTGDTVTGDFDATGAIFMGASPLVFEGLTDDGFQTSLAFTDPTAANTITFQDGTGTVAFLSDVVAGSSLFTDGGVNTYLTSLTDNLAIGGSTADAAAFGFEVSTNTLRVGDGADANGMIVMKASNGLGASFYYDTTDAFTFTSDVAINGDLSVQSFDAMDVTTSIVSAGSVSADTLGAATTNLDITLGDTGTLTFSDGANTLATLADNGTTGNLDVTGDISGVNGTFSGDVAVNGGDITTTSTALNVDIANTGSIFFRDGVNTLMTLIDNGTNGHLDVSGYISTGDLTATGDIMADGSLYGATGEFTGDVTAVNGVYSGDVAVNGGDLTSTATTFNIDVGDTGSFIFRDGTNTLASLVDNGTTGNLDVTGTISGGNITTTGDLMADGGVFGASADITGDVNAVNGVFSGNLSGVNGTFTGDISALDITSTRKILAASHALNQGLRLPTNAGTPAAVASTEEGDIVWDSTNDALYVYNGSDFANIADGISLFTDAGTVTHLTSTTDDFAIGGSAVGSSSFSVDTSTNEVYVGDGSGEDGEIILTSGLGSQGSLRFSAADIFVFTGGDVSMGADLDVTGTVNALNVYASNIVEGATVSSTGEVTAVGSISGSALSVTGDIQAVNGNFSGDVFVNGGDISSTATTFNIKVGNTGSFFFNDGANTLMTLADNGTTGNLTVSGDVVADYLQTQTDLQVVRDAYVDQDLFVTRNVTVDENVTFYGRLLSPTHADTQGLRLPTNVGAPAFVASTEEGDVVWDSSNDALYVYDGASFDRILSGDDVDLDVAYANDADKILTVNDGSLKFSVTGAGDEFVVDLQNDGDFRIQDAGSDVFVLNDNGTIDFTPIAGTDHIIDVTNLGTKSALFINQTSDLPAYIYPTATDGGAIHVNNTDNDGMAFSLYTANDGTTATAPLAYLRNEGAFYNQDILRLRNEGQASALHIDQQGDIRSGGAAVVRPSSGVGGALQIDNGANERLAFSIYSDMDSNMDAPLAYMLAENTTFDTQVLVMENWGTESTVDILANGTRSVSQTLANAVQQITRNPELDDAGAGTETLTITGSVLDITNAPVLTSGAGIVDSGKLIALNQSNTGATGNVLDISNSGTGSGVHIAQTGNTGSTAPATDANAALSIDNTSNDEMGLSIYSNHAASANASLVSIFAENTGFDQRAFDIQSYGTAPTLYVGHLNSASDAAALGIVNSGTGNGLSIGQFNASSTEAALNVYNNGTLNNGLALNQVNISSTEHAISVTNAGSKSGLFINQTGDTDNLAYAASGGALHINNTSNIGSAFTIYSDMNSGATGPLVYLKADNIAFDEEILYIQNEGVGESIFVNQYNDLAATVPTSTDGGAIHVSNTANDGMGLSVYSNNGSTASAALAHILVDNALFDEDALTITNDGVGAGISIYQNANTGSTGPHATSDAALNINNTLNDEMALAVYSDHSSGANGPLVSFRADNALYDGQVLDVRSDGTATAMRIVQGGTGGALLVDSATTTTNNVVEIDGTGLTDGVGMQVNVDLSLNGSTAGAAFRADYTGSSTVDRMFEVISDSFSTDHSAFYVEADGDVRIGDGAICLDNDGSCAGSTDGTIYYVASSVGSSDLAEIYHSDEVLEAGDVVAIDEVTGELRKTTTAYDSSAISAIATSPAMLMGAPSDEEIAAAGLTESEPNWGNYVLPPGQYPVALSGRIPVKVTTVNGSIQPGDLITSSSTPGVAMKATQPGNVIGRALEAYNGAGEGLIEVYVLSGWHSGGTIATDGSTGVFTDDFAFTSEGTATATDSYGSHGLSFKGSGWNGSAAENVKMTVLNDVTDSSSYNLVVRNTAEEDVFSVSESGDVMLAGKLYPSDRGTLQTDKYIYYDGSDGAGGDFMRTNAAGWSTGSYDFAEMFPSQDAVQPGEIVIFADDNETVKRSTGVTYDDRLAGIVSTRPGFLAGENIEGHAPIALAGRVPTFVSGENGSIQPGDPLTSSSTPGYAMKATEPGPIVGYAMEAFSGETGSIVAFVRGGYYDGSEDMNEAPAAENVASEITNISTLSVTGSINMNGGNILNANAIAHYADRWRIEDNGDVITKGRVTHIIESYQGEEVETYAALSRETTIQLSGTAQLVDGIGVVQFENIDPAFNDIIALDQPYRVLLTGSQPTEALYAVSRTNDGFMIRESNDGDSNVLVDWLVIAYHKDYVPGAQEEVAEAPVEEEEVSADEIIEEVPAEEPAQEEVIEEVPAEEPVQEEVIEEAPPAEEPPAEEVVEEPALEDFPSEEAFEEPLQEEVVEAPVEEEEVSADEIIEEVPIE